MGVDIGKAEGEYLTLLECENCDMQYETDETMSNDCPHCYRTMYDVKSDDYSGDWRTN